MPPFAVTFSQPFGSYARERVGEIAQAVTIGVRAAADGAKTDMRQTVERVLGRQVSFAIRGKTFPERGASLNAAGTIFVKRSAAALFQAFGEGATIVARNGARYLAIPTDRVPRKIGGVRGSKKRMSPDEVETHFNQDLKMMRARRAGVFLL